RVTNLGSITATDSSVWPLPAEIHFSDASFPASSDLHNSCTGHAYPDAAAAMAALDSNYIVTIDSGGELFTMFIFADNYFELYINGIPAGKDNVPYTPFNSSIVQFRANRPFTVAMSLVDWEERLGVGCETNATYGYYIGDGGMVAVIKDALGNTVATTGPSWKAQTYYTAPIKNLACVYETVNERRSDTCSTASSNSGSSYYGLHWLRPAGWNLPSFNDSLFPAAYTYSNATVGVNNKPAYTNFTGIFDDPSNDAQFIWSSNLILDNEVLVRYTVPSVGTGMSDPGIDELFELYPNPATGSVQIRCNESKIKGGPASLQITDMNGRTVWAGRQQSQTVSVDGWAAGTYSVRLLGNEKAFEKKLFIQ
ncbi:MAG: hypothetical protein RL021_141, partial [Bacteroidota bacterium]